MLGAALATLKASPDPDAHEYALVLQRLAYLSAMQGDPAEAQRLLETIPEDKGTDRLYVDVLRAYVRAMGEDKEPARELAMVCLNTVAERLRTHEPVPPAVFDILSKSFELLGNGQLKDSLKRLGEAPGDLEGKPG